MKAVRETIATRIVKATTGTPLTIKQIADVIYTDESSVRVNLQQMEEKGLMRRAGFGAPTRGNTPYLWVAA